VHDATVVQEVQALGDVHPQPHNQLPVGVPGVLLQALAQSSALAQLHSYHHLGFDELLHAVGKHQANVQGKISIR
jgi:hypothetical protein